jgi:hypothetical protein
MMAVAFGPTSCTSGIVPGACEGRALCSYLYIEYLQKNAKKTDMTDRTF